MALVTFDEAMKYPEHFCIIDDDKKEYPGYFSNIRVDRRTLPEGWHAYDLRESDWSDEGWFSTIEANYVMVNHAGTFLTKEELPLVEDKTGKKWAPIGTAIGEWSYSFCY